MAKREHRKFTGSTAPDALDTKSRRPWHGLCRALVELFYRDWGVVIALNPAGCHYVRAALCTLPAAPKKEGLHGNAA